MPSRRDALAVLGVGGLAALAGWGVSAWHAPADAEPLRSARFADLGGVSRSLHDWSDRVLVVNFWGTWCPPCREEIPALVAARAKLLPSGVEFVGIAIDQAVKVAQFVRNVPISYPILIADPNALSLVRELGNPSGALPFTVVLDRKGRVTHRNLGAVTQQKIERQALEALQA